MQRILAYAGRGVLALLYLATIVIVTEYFLRLLQVTRYRLRDYFAILFNESMRWLPLTFAIVPASALILQYSYAGFLSGMVYFALIGLWFWIRNKRARIAFSKTHRARRLILMLHALWILIFLICWSLKRPARTPIIEILVAAYVLQPVIVALGSLLAIPIEKLDHWYYVRQARQILKGYPDLQMIGIAGSNGKTSFKRALYTILAAGKGESVLETPGSTNTLMGIVRTIREGLKPFHKIFLCEMGALHPGEITEITATVKPSIGILTSIGYHHLVTMRTLPNIIRSAYEMFDAMEPGTPMFINGDNELIREHNKYPDAITFGLSEGCRYRGSILNVSRDGTDFLVTFPGDISETYHMKLVGRHNLVNVVGAIAIASWLGLPQDKIKQGVENLTVVPHRLELSVQDHLTIIDDTMCESPEGAQDALEVMGLYEGIRIIVTPGISGLGNMTERTNRLLGGDAARICDAAILVGRENTRSFRMGMQDAGFVTDHIYLVDTLSDARRKARELAGDQEAVVLLESDFPAIYD